MKTRTRLLACLAAALLTLPAAACMEPKGPNPDAGTQETVYALSFGQESFLLAMTHSEGTMSASALLTKDKEPVEGDISYTVEDRSVATFEGGMLTAVGRGRTSIVASCTMDGQSVSARADVTVLGETTAEKVNDLEDLALFGRTYTQGGALVLGNVCTGFETAFYGTWLTCDFTPSDGQIRYFVDGDEEGVLARLDGEVEIGGLEEGVHTVRVLKASSPQYGEIVLAEDPLSTDGVFLTPIPKSELKIEFLGDSIAAGCGALGDSFQPQQTVENSDPTKAFAYLTAQRLGADPSVIALEGMCIKDTLVRGYDAYLTLSVDNTAAYPGPYDADVVVLALAENDMWHATSDLFPNYDTDKFAEDYRAMLARIREKNADAYIVCVYGMMPMSNRPAAKTIVEGAIADMGDTKVSSLYLRCSESGANSHPDAKTHSANADRLVKHIRTLLGGNV